MITTHEEELKAMLVALQASANEQLEELRMLRQILIGSLDKDQCLMVSKYLKYTTPPLSPDEADCRAGFLKTTETDT